MGVMEAQLKQRGRSSIEFLADLAGNIRPLHAAVNQHLEKSGITPENLPDDLDERLNVMAKVLSTSNAFSINALLGDWSGTTHGLVARAAFEEMRDELTPVLATLEQKGPATLERNEDLVTPPYWTQVEIHRTAGGWDGHDYQGYIYGEIIHKHYVFKNYPGDIFAQRRQVLKELGRTDYEKIMEVGTSYGHFTLALQETFPDAEIYGVDMSLRGLEQSLRVANEKGYPWKLFRRLGEDTRFDANSFDLVASYIVLHEIPADAVRALFKEAFRVLKPGGDMLFADVTRYAAMDKLQVWRAEYGAVYGGEPFWRESASLDLAEEARKIGFVDAQSYGLNGKMNYPWIVRARKPA
jgi:SAM-dependent methyltransferase